MATTTTSKIAEAISLLSDVLSKEVDTGSQFADEDDSVSADDHDDLKSLAEDFATDAQISLEEVQVELQAIVDPDDEEDSDMYSWNPLEGSDEDDDDDYFDDNDEDDDADDDPGNGEVDLTGDDDVDPADDDDETEPTDEVKIDMLTLAGAELEEKIEDQEQTIEDLKNTMSSVLDNVNTLLEATQTFNDALDDA